jgi:hypothetical protein
VGHVRQERPQREDRRGRVPNVPGIDYGRKVEKASLESAGIKTTLVGFDANATDLTAR